MKKLITILAAAFIFAAAGHAQACGGGCHQYEHGDIRIDIGWGGDQVSAQGGNAASTAGADASSDIRYENRVRVPYRVPEGVVSPAPNRASDDGPIFTQPFTTQLGEQKVSILPGGMFRKVPVGENYFEIHLPEGTYLTKYMGPLEIKQAKQGIFARAEEARNYYSRAVREAVSGVTTTKRLLVVADEFFEAQYVSKSLNPLSGVYGGKNGAAGGGVGKNTSWEENAKNVVLHPYEVLLGPYTAYIVSEPVEPPPQLPEETERVEPPPQPEPPRAEEAKVEVEKKPELPKRRPLIRPAESVEDFDSDCCD